MVPEAASSETVEHDDELMPENVTYPALARTFHDRKHKGILLMLRNISLAIFATVSAFTVAGLMSPAPAAEAIQDSYCLQGRQHGYPGSCQFSSYQQCMATASGTGEGCGINPMKAFAQQRRGGDQGH